MYVLIRPLYSYSNWSTDANKNQLLRVLLQLSRRVL